jgi:hypothetical protein
MRHGGIYQRGGATFWEATALAPKLGKTFLLSLIYLFGTFDSLAD